MRYTFRFSLSGIRYSENACAYSLLPFRRILYCLPVSAPNRRGNAACLFAQVLNRNGSGCFKNHGSGLGLLGNFLYSIGVLNGTPPEAGNNSLCRKLQEYFLFFSLLFFIALSFCFDPCLFNKLLQALRSPGCYQPKIQQRRIFFRKHPSFQFLRNLPQIT